MIGRKQRKSASNDNARLWMPVKVKDETGYLNIYMREKAALSPSGTDTKDKFEAACR